MVDSAERNQRVPNIGDLEKKYQGQNSSLQLQLIKSFIANLGFLYVFCCPVFSIVSFN